MAISLESKFLGGMVGVALGDAIGELAFRWFDPKELLSQVEHQAVLRYTDDTAMTIGLAESLIEMGYIDDAHLGDTFRVNFNREPWRGYASGPPAIFSRVEWEHIGYVEAARDMFGGQGSFGNGAAMRIAPVGLFYYDDPMLYERARASSIVTHTHPVGIDGAAVLACAIARVVPLDPSADFQPEALANDLVEFARTPEIRAKMAEAATCLQEKVSPSEAARRLGRSVAVQESMPFALYAFLRHPKSFHDCLLCAITHGGDRDTLGAMAGALSGTYLGVEGIPQAWQRKLENREYIESLAVRLARLKRADAT